MRRSDDPHRQCIGCRTVRPKKELVRLIYASGQAVFDGMQTAQGRGIYLCPDGMCFHRAFKNKKWNKYFHDSTHLRKLFDGILEALYTNIQGYLALGARMKLLRDPHEELGHLTNGDLVIVHRNTSGVQKEEILSAACNAGAAVIDVSGDCMKVAATQVVKEGFPHMARLRRDLHLYEMLLSKGLAI